MSFILSPSVPAAQSLGSHYCLPFGLVYSADTIYSAELPGALHTLSALSAVSSLSHRFPPIVLCIERRDCWSTASRSSQVMHRLSGA